MESDSIFDLIKMTIRKFNDDKHCNDGIYVQLRERWINYEIKPSKKNGYPKIDYPSFCKSISIKDTSTYSFSLIVKPEDMILVNKVSKPTRCEKCIVW